MKRNLIFLLVLTFICGIIYAEGAEGAENQSPEIEAPAAEAPASNSASNPAPLAESAPKASATDSDDEKLEELNKQIEEMEERLDTVETSTLVDRVKLSFDYRFTLNSYIFRENSKEATIANGLIREDGNTPQAWNMRGRLKLISRLGENFKFTGWLTMYKHFLESAPGRYANDSALPSYDMSRGTYPGDSTVYFERMYVDWFVTDWVSLMVGRAPASGGEPSNFRYNDVSLGTFNAITFDMPFDGAYLTFNLNSLFGLQNSYFRVGYVPKFMPDVSQNQNNQIKEVDYGTQHSVIAGIDLEIPGLNGSKFSANYALVPEIKAPQINADYDKDGDLDKLSMPDSLGFLALANAGLVFPRAFNSDFDLFILGGMSQINPAVPTKEDPNNGFIGTPAENSKSTPLYSALGNDLSGDSLTGYILYTGFRYNIPVEMNGDRFRIGAEYNYATENYFFFYQLDTTGLPKFGIRGHNLESYFMIPLDRKANLRLSYIYQKHQYEWGMLARTGQGIPEINETIHNINLMLNVYF